MTAHRSTTSFGSWAVSSDMVEFHPGNQLIDDLKTSTGSLRDNRPWTLAGDAGGCNLD